MNLNLIIKKIKKYESVGDHGTSTTSVIACTTTCQQQQQQTIQPQQQGKYYRFSVDNNNQNQLSNPNLAINLKPSNYQPNIPLQQPQIPSAHNGQNFGANLRSNKVAQKYVINQATNYYESIAINQQLNNGNQLLK